MTQSPLAPTSRVFFTLCQHDIRLIKQVATLSDTLLPRKQMVSKQKHSLQMFLIICDNSFFFWAPPAAQTGSGDEYLLLPNAGTVQTCSHLPVHKGQWLSK